MGEIIILPIQRCVKKYVINDFGPEPIICRQNNPQGKAVLSILNKKGKESVINKQHDTIMVELSADLIAHKTTILKKAKHLTLFYDYFRLALRHSVESSQPFFGSRRLAILSFLRYNDISEDDLSLETCQRFFHRRGVERQVFLKRNKGQQLASAMQYIDILEEKNQKLEQQIKEMCLQSKEK
ncbi:basic helix-loop-helix domain-containing protein [Flammeovirga aprica]|uniref:Uncharacterized protein n=1 Tax=Flammeovirga aprica JL-4 TaxID=694437 RepID=A0A7X9P1B3_9BACT|nr:hypothetical protein [Flammeovirga aprica]NME67192.1 hypothetical protein [Flammeovirga aprica JL-4]